MKTNFKPPEGSVPEVSLEVSQPGMSVAAVEASRDGTRVWRIGGG